MAFEGGPYITAAVICEKVLEDKEGVLSLIRLIDRITVTAQGPAIPEALPPATLQMTLVISLKSGDARGRHSLKIRPEQPSGQQMDTIEMSVHFEGEDRGMNVVYATSLSVDQEGLYWFDVLLDDVLLTRMPLRILYQRQTAGS